MPQKKDKITNGHRVTSPAIPQPLDLPEPEQILLNELQDAHRSVKRLLPLLDLLDPPESHAEDLGGRLMAILADTREQVQILGGRLEALMKPNSAVMAELSRLREAQDRTTRMVEKILVLLNEPVS